MEAKKEPRKNVYRLSNLWFNLGLLLSLAAVITAFEWRTLQDPVVDFDPGDVYDQQNEIIPPTVIPPPPKPKPVVVNKVEVLKNEEPEIELPDFRVDLTDVKIPDPVDMDMPDDEPAPEYVTYAEVMPEPVGGYEAFYKFVSKNLKYPSQAKKLGIEGKVYVQFIVDEHGNISDVEIARGIGAGCDEEVLRVMKNAPKWHPGKQRAVPVKVRMMIPIIFTLK